MEITMFIISLIASIMFQKLKFLFFVLFSSATIYPILKIFHPELTLRPFKDWTFENLFFGYNFWFSSFLIFLLVGFIFYVIIPLLISKIYIFFYSEINSLKNRFDSEIKKGISICINFLKVLNYKFNFKKNIQTTAKRKKDINEEINIFHNQFILFISYSIHVSVLIFLYANKSLTIVISIIIVFIILIFNLAGLAIIENDSEYFEELIKD